MKIIETISELREQLDEARSEGKRIGLVPTMGYFHEGHLSLMEAARAETDLVVTSIFVNPLQFGPREDFDGYPRDFARDSMLAEKVGVDLIFQPSVGEMYPEGATTTLDVGRIGEIVEGAIRPGHFNGVATVCTKLFNIAQPHKAFFGQKDAQQLSVIRKVVRDLAMNIDIVDCPTVREADGLAMSSRNVYLTSDDRKAAPALAEALFSASALVQEGARSAASIKACVRERLSQESSVKLQYVEVTEENGFEPVENISGRLVVSIAAFIGTTRLIDNVRVDVGTGKPA
jgi:pantoate--beta-alanine ligase